jgi:hypothetical protein
MAENTYPNTPTTGKATLLSRIIGKRRESASPDPRTAWAIDADTLTQAIFGLDGDDCDPALADLCPHEKRELSKRIESRLRDLGWAVEFGRGGVAYQGHEPFRKLREISETGGVFYSHIADMIDRCHDYVQAKKRLGRAALYPWPIKEVRDHD